MTSDKGAPMDGLEVQVAQVRDSLLIDGEELVAQEMGDNGQVIILTNSRILIIKVGLTATGTFNGQKSAVYPLDQVKSVNVRKGPVGAVIQVCSDIEQPAEPGCSPMNIVVFSGVQKIKRCDAIAALIETALGKPVDKFEPTLVESAQAEVQVETVSDVELNEDHAAMIDEDGRYVIPDEPVSGEDVALESVNDNSTPDYDLHEDTPVDILSAASPSAVTEDESTPAKRGGREARSLAEEMFEDTGDWEASTAGSAPQASQIPAASSQHPVAQLFEVDDDFKDLPESEPASEVSYAFGPPIPIIGEDAPAPVTTGPTTEAEALEPVMAAVSSEQPKASEPASANQDSMSEFKPNPYLPKPLVKKAHTPSGVPILLGALMLVLMVGMAVIAPMRNAEKAVSVAGLDASDLAQNAKVLRRHIAAVDKYRMQAENILQSAGTSSIENALRSHNAHAVASAAAQCNVDAVWKQLNSLPAPAGLAAAREDLVSGLFIRKAAVMNAASGSLSPQEALNRFAEANALIQRGFAEINKLRSDLSAQAPDPLSDKTQSGN